MFEFSSSTSPMAWMRRLFLETRCVVAQAGGAGVSGAGGNFV
jgi:hypothetical protein